MPRITAKDVGASTMKVMHWPCKGLAQQELLDMACGFDTDEKWVMIFITIQRDGKTKCLTSNGSLQMAKLYIDFEVIDKTTGEVLYSVRQ